MSKNVGVILGGVFNSGILATGVIGNPKYNYTPAPKIILEKVRKIETVCRSYSIPLPTAAMHFCLGHPQVSSLALGAVSPDEIKSNISAIKTTVPKSLWSDLKTEGLLENSVPTPD
jgi:D-threo-aldose 1-dehydrogenase